MTNMVKANQYFMENRPADKNGKRFSKDSMSFLLKHI